MDTICLRARAHGIAGHDLRLQVCLREAVVLLLAGVLSAPGGEKAQHYGQKHD